MTEARPSSATGMRGGLLHAALLLTGAASALADALPPLPTIINQFADTPLSAAIEANGGDLPATPLAPLRPLKIEFYLSPSIPPPEAALKDYIFDELLPTVQSLLGRSMQVRNPSGVLDLGGKTFLSVKPQVLVGFVDANTTIPVPKHADGSPAAGYDADAVFEVSIAPGGCSGTPIRDTPVAAERGTNRAIFGYIEFCTLERTLSVLDIRSSLLGILDALVLNPGLFFAYPRAPGAPFPPAAFLPSGGSVTLDPQVVDHVRTFFDCATALGGETEGTASGPNNGGWELRTYLGEAFVARPPFTDSHYSRQALTDLTLSQIQSSNWYNVLYGSQGFVSYGYQAGCEFVNVTAPFEEALAVPEAARYLCPAVANDTLRCHHDHSGAGVCTTDAFLDPFITTIDFPNIPGEPVKTLDCQSSGLRCLQQKGGAASPECVDMSCSPSGDVLIGGSPCDPGRFDCPERNVMCGDPGFLTCRDSLNDCSGAGDCFRGRCFCHLGFGGDDCSKRLCINHCADGSACPPSGVCGEPVCGKFSTGADDRGTPCNAPLTSKIPSVAPPLPPSKPSPKPSPKPSRKPARSRKSKRSRKPARKQTGRSRVSITINGVKVPFPPKRAGSGQPPATPSKSPKRKVTRSRKDGFTFVVASSSTSGATATVKVKQH